MRRREFLQTLGRSTGALAALPLVSALPARAPSARNANDRVELGRTGIRVSRLAMGTGTRGSGGSSDQTRQGMAPFLRNMEHAYEHGVNFWDSADQYGSHTFLRESLKRVPRQQVVILTKTHASTAEQMRSDLDRFQKEIGTDYLDVVLLHCMTSADWPQEKEGAMQVLERAREQGRIRAHGVSCHDLGAIQTAVKNSWVQVELQRINPAGVHMDADQATIISLLRQAKANGQAVIGMKIFGEGQLSSQPDLALGHAIRLDCLDAFTIGVMSTNQFDDISSRLPRLSAV